MIQILEKPESSTQLDSEIDSKFKKVRTRYSTKSATEDPRLCDFKNAEKTLPYGGLFKKNATWESRISTLRSMPDDVKNEGAYLFFGVKTSIVSEYHFRETPLSGGQRAEYLFLRLLEESQTRTSS